MRTDRGFALIAALWLLVALSALTLEVSLVARERRLAAANTLEAAQARAAADAGLEHARGRLAAVLRGGALDPWRQPDSLLSQTVALGDARYRVALRDAGSALNVNRATEAELFPTLEELGYVKEMTPEILTLARPHLTLLGTGQVNLNAAPRPVLLALAGIGEEAAGVLLRHQEARRPIRSLAELSLELSSGARAALQAEATALLGRAAFETREVEAVSDGWAEGSPVRARDRGLLVRARDVAFLVWRRAE